MSEMLKTKEQKYFEQFCPVLLNIFLELNQKNRQNLIDYAIALYNKEVKQWNI